MATAPQPLRLPVSDDATLVALAAAGDRAAFRALYDRHLPRVRGLAARLLGPGARGSGGEASADLDDVVQDVFIQLHRSLASFRGDSAFSTWLHRLTWNVAVSHLRSRRPCVDLTSLLPMQLSRDEWKRLEARDLVALLYAALDDLADDSREAFLLFYVEGMTLQEIADLTSAPLPTVAARVRRSRERVTVILGAAAGPRGSANLSDGGRA